MFGITDITTTKAHNRFQKLVPSSGQVDYGLEAAEQLDTVVWKVISKTRGNGAMLLIADPTTIAPQRFSRVRVD